MYLTNKLLWSVQNDKMMLLFLPNDIVCCPKWQLTSAQWHWKHRNNKKLSTNVVVDLTKWRFQRQNDDIDLKMTLSAQKRRWWFQNDIFDFKMTCSTSRWHALLQNNAFKMLLYDDKCCCWRNPNNIFDFKMTLLISKWHY